jgi:hypothetical protein
MANDTKPGRKRPITRVLKAIGYLTDPATKPGKVFAWWEKGMTGVMGKLAQNDLYLNVAGKMMERTFQMHGQSIRAMEEMLHAMRLPTTSDVTDLREQVHHLNDQVEAMSAQIEVLVEALEAQKKGPPGANGAPNAK